MFAKINSPNQCCSQFAHDPLTPPIQCCEERAQAPHTKSEHFFASRCTPDPAPILKLGGREGATRQHPDISPANLFSQTPVGAKRVVLLLVKLSLVDCVVVSVRRAQCHTGACCCFFSQDKVSSACPSSVCTSSAPSCAEPPPPLMQLLPRPLRQLGSAPCPPPPKPAAPLAASARRGSRLRETRP